VRHCSPQVVHIPEAADCGGLWLYAVNMASVQGRRWEADVCRGGHFARLIPIRREPTRVCVRLYWFTLNACPCSPHISDWFQH
jgi:hypothetical protein